MQIALDLIDPPIGGQGGQGFHQSNLVFGRGFGRHKVRIEGRRHALPLLYGSPIHGRNCNLAVLGCAVAQQVRQDGYPQWWRNRLALSQCALHRAHRHATVRPGAPVDTQRRQPLLVAIVRQTIQKGVGGGIVALAGIAQQRRGRGEEDQEIQIKVCGELMQQPTARHFGREDRCKACPLLIHQNGIIQEPSRVKDPFERQRGRADLGEERAHGGFISYIDLCHLYRDPLVG